MQFISTAGNINVNRIVRINRDDTGYIIAWLNEHDKADSFRLRKAASEVLQHHLST